MYRPLVLVSYALNYRVGGFEVRGYHVVNLLLHVLVTWLVYGLLVSIGGSGYGGLFAPALFGVHPLTAEPVNYISNRSESMAALFALLSFYLYARSSRGRPSLLSLSAFAGALLSKSTAVCLPLALILYEISQRGEGGRGGGVYGVASGRSGCALVYVAGSSALIRRGDDGGEAQVMDGPGQHAGERTVTIPRSRRIPGADDSTPEREPPGASASAGIFPLSSGFRKPRETHQR